MNFNIFSFIASAIMSGTPLFFGTMGETLTQKSGNMNLGVEGLMYMGGAFGITGALAYQNAMGGAANPYIIFLIALVCSFAAGVAGALIFSFLTITLKSNQNVTGLALTTFGTGVAQFVGELAKKANGGNVSLDPVNRGIFVNSPFPDFMQNIPFIGKILFGQSIFFYMGVLMAVIFTLFYNKTRAGLNLRAVGESPSTADAAGINVIKSKYFATVIGGGISAVGGMIYIMTLGGTAWDARALSGEGWIAVALVIFCLWKPLNSIWGSVLFGALLIMYLRVPIAFIPSQIYKVMPYIVTVFVLIFVSMRQRREDQPPAALGLAYFREER